MSRTTLILAAILIIVMIGVLAYYALGPSRVAASYPQRPITIYVPWSPGGGTDLTTRQVAAYLQQKFGVEINVLNRVAGGGAATFYAGAKENPDGYTLTAITIELSIFPHLGTSNVTFNDFEPIAMLICNPAVVAVRQDAPWKSLRELLDYVKSHPGELRASGTSQAGVWDMARIGLLQAAGISPSALPWVPSAGAAPAIQELLAGGVQVVFVGSGEIKPYKDSGQARVLAIMSDKRIKGLDDVPTLKELGYDFTICGWAGLAAPKNTPEPIINKLAEAIKEAYNSQQFQQFLDNRSYVGKLLLTEEFKNYLANEYDKMKVLLEKAGYLGK